MLPKVTNTFRLGILLVVIVWALLVGYLWIYGPGSNQSQLLVDDGYRAPITRSNSSAVRINMSGEVHVCIAGEESTLGGMIAAINSVHSNTRASVVFHLVTERRSTEHLREWIDTSLPKITYMITVFPKEWVQDKIKVKDARPELANPMTFARFYLPKLFPGLKGKVLYIDDDSVVQGDVQRLISSVTFKEGKVAAVSDDCTAMNKRFSILQNFYLHFINFNNHKIANVGMKKTACSFNTGVFVFDADQWRKYNITENLDKWMALNKKEDVFGDEKAGGASAPPMMIALYNRTIPLDPNWNVRFLGTSTTMKKYSVPFLQSAKLLHWSGPDKPWLGRSPYVDLWEKWFIPDPTKKFRLARKSGIL